MNLRKLMYLTDFEGKEYLTKVKEACQKFNLGLEGEDLINSIIGQYILQNEVQEQVLVSNIFHLAEIAFTHIDPLGALKIIDRTIPEYIRKVNKGKWKVGSLINIPLGKGKSSLTDLEFKLEQRLLENGERGQPGIRPNAELRSDRVYHGW
jgi:hypothetical protein